MTEATKRFLSELRVVMERCGIAEKLARKLPEDLCAEIQPLLEQAGNAIWEAEDLVKEMDP